MNELKFLGRGSGYNFKEGNTSGFIKKNETLLLIDCGESIFKRIVEMGLTNGIKDIHVLITHMHSDHIGSLSGFVGYCYWKYKIVTNVYFHDKDKMRKLLDITGFIEGESFNVNDTINTRIDSLGMEFYSVQTKHVKTLNAYSYILKFDDGNDIFYSGDTCETNLDVISFLKEGNIIYHDTCLNDGKDNVHTSLRVLSEVIPEEYRKQVYCMHIDGENFVDRAEKMGFSVVQVS